jgi:Rieske Fe-S protein
MQVRVSDANNLAEGEMRVLDIAGSKVSIAASGGRLFAFDDTCTHRGCSLGAGELDGDKLEAYPPGMVIVLAGNTSHFHWAKSGEYVSQVTAIGPRGLE